VAGLSDAQVDHFINRWFDAAHQRVHGITDKARQKALADRHALSAVLKTAPYQAPSMREMVTNPLLLTILCVVYHEEHNLPTARAELYQHCVRVLLGLWRRELFTEAPAGRDFKPFDIEAAQSVLARIAWWLHQQEKRTTATVAELQTEAEAGLQTVAASAGLGNDGRLFLERMRQESGIMAFSGDGSGKLGFLHLSFQEFLAADYAVRAELAAVLAPRAANSWWREAALLSLRRSEAFCGRFFREFLAQGLAEQDLDLAYRCLNESLYFPPEPFLAVLRAADAPLPRKTAVLKLLRDRAAQVPGLAEICEEWVGLPDAKHPDLYGMALEILTVLGRPPRSATAARLAGDLMIHPETGMTMVWVPPGTFQMGSNKGRPSEQPIHSVVITRGFYLGKYPVTNEQYARFLATRPPGIKTPEYWDYRKFNQPQQPVVGVSWNDAVAFCRWMGGRLPTEAEWEYACRAGCPHEYCFGDDEKLLGDYAWFIQNSDDQTQPVGGKLPNAWGLHDMHGNVWEWCQDRYESSYYRRSPDQDPRGPDSGSFRVLRGGSWDDVPSVVRCARRSSSTPDSRGLNVGFRLVLE
jgi:formylglycine-generating enzyme required for sulfatase activity